MTTRSALLGALLALAGTAAAASATTPTDVVVQLFQWNVSPRSTARAHFVAVSPLSPLTHPPALANPPLRAQVELGRGRVRLARRARL